MKYKVGQKVVVKPSALLVSGDATNNHLDGTDRVVTIKGIDYTDPSKQAYTALFPDGNWYYLYEANILGPHFKYGQEIEISDNGTKWKVKKFACHNPSPNSNYPIGCSEENFTYARPIQPTPETIEVEGKKYEAVDGTEQGYLLLREVK